MCQQSIFYVKLHFFPCFAIWRPYCTKNPHPTMHTTFVRFWKYSGIDCTNRTCKQYYIVWCVIPYFCTPSPQFFPDNNLHTQANSILVSHRPTKRRGDNAHCELGVHNSLILMEGPPLFLPCFIENDSFHILLLTFWIDWKWTKMFLDKEQYVIA